MDRTLLTVTQPLILFLTIRVTMIKGFVHLFLPDFSSIVPILAILTYLFEARQAVPSGKVYSAELR
jgi:hypothetical protein